MKIILRILKWVFIFIIALLIIGFVITKVYSEERPPAIPNTDADAVAERMLAAINKPAWDTLDFLRWEFMGGHRYLWDKQENNAVISWGDNEVILNLDKVDGVAFTNGVAVSNDEANGLIHTAWSYWCNDSFWMFAPFKIFDPGTSRSIVETVSDHTGLMVTYDSGGVTPGDSYLWLLDDNDVPTGYKMWTFIPIKGMYMSWENWKPLQGGAQVAISHNSKVLSFDMKDVAEGDSPSELGYDNTIFSKLQK